MRRLAGEVLGGLTFGVRNGRKDLYEAGIFEGNGGRRSRGG